MITPSLTQAVTHLAAGGFRVTPYGMESAIHGYYGKEIKAVGWKPPKGYFDIAQTFFHLPCPNTYIDPAAYARQVNRLQEMATDRRGGVPLHLSIDQEGDFSHDWPFGGIRLFPANMGLRAAGGPKLAHDVGRAVGRQLSAIGANMIHSPVCDVNINPDNPEINTRSFSDDPAVQARYALELMKGLRDGGLIPTAKHFPGRGDSDMDAHDELPTLRAARSRLDAVELAPYRTLIAAGLPAIMSAHNAYTALDAEGVPATLSRRILTDLLRGELGFQGVLTTDAMGMGAIIKRWGVPVAAAMAISAGADLVLLKFDDELRSQSFFEIKRWVADGRITEAELDVHVRRILRMKADRGLFDSGGQVDPEAVAGVFTDEGIGRLSRDAARKCVTVLRDRDGLLPLRKGQRLLVIEQQIPEGHLSRDAHYHEHSFIEAVLGQSGNVIAADSWMEAQPNEEERLLGLARQADVVVMTNWFWRIVPNGNRLLAGKIAKGGKPVVVVTNNPYPMADAPAASTALCTYGPGPESLAAAVAVLFGKRKAQGRWPLEHFARPR